MADPADLMPAQRAAIDAYWAANTWGQYRAACEAVIASGLPDPFGSLVETASPKPEHQPSHSAHALPCRQARCGAVLGGCDIKGCPAQAVKRAKALAALPPEMIEALEYGAVGDLHQLEGDLTEIPMGRIAAVALGGFLAGLPRGWRLTNPDGAAVRPYDIRLALEGWSAKLQQDEPAGDFGDG